MAASANNAVKKSFGARETRVGKRSLAERKPCVTRVGMAAVRPFSSGRAAVLLPMSLLQLSAQVSSAPTYGGGRAKQRCPTPTLGSYAGVAHSARRG
jgi:hypothetical protein